MFLCRPLLDVLITRRIEDIDPFIQTPSWSDFPEPASIPAMTQGCRSRSLRTPGETANHELCRLRLRRDLQTAHLVF